MWENKANTKPIQSQYKANTNPISEKPKMNENLFATKVYENITTFRLEQNKPNQTQYEPNQTQPVVSLPALFTLSKAEGSLLVVSLPALSKVEVSNQSKGSNLFPPAPTAKTPATGRPVAEKLTGKKLIILSLDSSVSAV